VQKFQEHDFETHRRITFIVQLGDGAFDEIMPMALWICFEDLEGEELTLEHKAWIFTYVIGHHGPICKFHKEYEGTLYNVLLLWDDGSEKYEPLEMVIKDDPVTLASYALKHDLLGQSGWKNLKAIATKLHCEQRICGDFSLKVLASKQSKDPVLQFGVQVPRNVFEAYILDK
jgi:hypothetical protein